MKINKKLIGFGIASLGAMMSIGGAFALYTQSAENVSFGISAGTYAGSGGSVVYKINGAGGTSEVAPSYLTTVGENGGTGLSATYTQVEYQTSKGRVDMIVKTDKYIYIMEFKRDSSAEAAMKQIKDQGYADPFRSDGRKIILIGANFASDMSGLDGVLVEEG